MQSASSLIGQRLPSAALLALGAGLGALAQASLTRIDDVGADAPPELAARASPNQCAEQSAARTDHERMRAKYENKIKKLANQSLNKVHWPAAEKEMLGLAPRLWMETLDEHHRYASILNDYWRRWQLSDTPLSFFPWLDSGQGSLIDLPHAPRRLLDEWRVLYLQKEKQPLFGVVIEEGTGRFLWEADGMPVDLPPIHSIGLDVPKAPQEIADATAAAMAAAVRASSGELSTELRPTVSPLKLGATGRERAVAALLDAAVERARVRDGLLEDARAQVMAAISAGEAPEKSRMEEIARPLVDEGLVCQLRDPFFTDRHDAAPTAEGHAYLWHMKELPTELLPDKTWQEFLIAIDHDQGKSMKRPLNTADRFDGKGIFVLDSFGPLYCGLKIRGVFHHSSFVRGHAVKVAGGLRIENGWLKDITPHSGHYQPSEEMVEEMMAEWTNKGVDFSLVKISPYTK